MTAGFIPYAAAMVPLFSMIPGLGSSASYAPVPLLILVYALLLRQRLPDTARGLAIGAGILILSLTFRTLDQPLCGALPFGTHFLWPSKIAAETPRPPDPPNSEHRHYPLGRLRLIQSAPP
ncbi:hypothetical protein [Paracoccus simplex]|uniref:Uncharacterized protein n=1 Tax=Paracoccus simplex TaxID=2086346 RepID=A0ABV7RT01_9RHOB